MAQFYTLVQSIVILVALILSAFWLKKRSVISEADRGTFSRLMIDFALPALIFANLARSPALSPEKILPALLMFISISTVMSLVWIAGKMMRLERRVLGSVILVAGIGSSSTLGYALVQQVFKGNPLALNDAVILGEFGVGISLFVLGAAVAVYYGRDNSEKRSTWDASKQFFFSPIFLSLISGVAVSFVSLPQEHWVVRVLFRILDAAAVSLPLLVALTIGLMLRPVEFRTLWPLIILVVVFKLVIEPLLAGLGGLVLAIPELDRQVLTLEAAMPSGAIAAVLAARYGCDGAIASSLVIVTYFFTLVTLPLIFLLAA